MMANMERLAQIRSVKMRAVIWLELRSPSGPPSSCRGEIILQVEKIMSRIFRSSL